MGDVQQRKRIFDKITILAADIMADAKGRSRNRLATPLERNKCGRKKEESF